MSTNNKLMTNVHKKIKHISKLLDEFEIESEINFIQSMNLRNKKKSLVKRNLVIKHRNFFFSKKVKFTSMTPIILKMTI